MNSHIPLIFDKSVEGHGKIVLDSNPLWEKIPEFLPEQFKRKEKAKLPQVSEPCAVRHFTLLSQQNFGVDTGFYPLGSCTMKYNPKINEEMAAVKGFSGLHPHSAEEFSQGSLELMYDLTEMLREIVGMDALTLTPVAGAHGELTGLMIIKSYHLKKEGTPRKYILVPDSAHGTNPATVSMCGYETITIPSDEKGGVDVQALSVEIEKLGEEIAGLMLTNPNTLGIFDPNILEITSLIKSVGGLLYYDGANLNAIMGKCKPGDMGFDVVHINLHKTFSTPHGGGGPGGGAVGVKGFLKDYLPGETIVKSGETFQFSNPSESIGRVIGFYGNFGIMVRAYVYLLRLGSEGVVRVSEFAVLAANYLKYLLKDHFAIPYQENTLHEFVASASNFKEKHIHAMDFAKRLLDYGFHAPTVYFPMIVEEAMMIEPTETESVETLEEFADVLKKIIKEIDIDPDLLHLAPHSTIYSRFDEAIAARKPVLAYKWEERE